MSQIVGLADKQFVSDQYKNAKQLNARIQLHQRFSTNKYGWHRWAFDQFSLPPHGRILELGCGSGELWLENIDRIPAKWEITLSDSSVGMLQQTRQSLDHSHRFRFALIDAQYLPFDNQYFDGVVANHMLYHVPDMHKALSEIHRVLKPDGSFCASTVGQKHLQEITDLVRRFDPQLAWWGIRQSDSFVLENGAAQLARRFTDVTLHRYEDSLVVTEPAPLVAYIFSARPRMTIDQQVEFSNFVSREFQRFNGEFYITKDAGMFVSRHPLHS
ncbi:MAG: methyltransferase domain-containing protein [Anaerolineae bacterium]|nr:methyltransferase domain-containing protein [Anaerolineae bacterium]